MTSSTTQKPSAEPVTSRRQTSPAKYHDHTWENGRRYRGHKSEYPWPNDEEATKAYSCLHGAWYFLLRPADLVRAPAPFRRGTKVLDCCARDISWVDRVADDHAGVRVSVIDPVCTWLYPTSVTVHHEVEGKWPFRARQAFHLVRANGLGGMVADYAGLYGNAYKHLLPGGWFEVRDNDLQFFTDVPENEEKLVALRRWEGLMAEAAEKFGKPINMSAKHKAFMEEAGFTKVQEEVYKLPLGDWMEGEPWVKVKSMTILHMRHGLEGYTLRLFTKTLGWSLEDTKAFIEEVKEEIADAKLKNLRLYSYFRIVIGKKPEDASRKP
ncbi:hypothetical protein BJX63DRAFT_135179 [Aspergillus granulosus]|uniref:Uncharacterized protein n=1 Tax=Aspergillus granulosus TaxID=176169 RepID=A0ABR4HMU7_9EURO